MNLKAQVKYFIFSFLIITIDHGTTGLLLATDAPTVSAVAEGSGDGTVDFGVMAEPAVDSVTQDQTLAEFDPAIVKLDSLNSTPQIKDWCAKVLDLYKKATDDTTSYISDVPVNLWADLQALVNSKPFYDKDNKRDYRVNNPVIYQCYRALKLVIKHIAENYTDSGVAFKEDEPLREKTGFEEFAYDGEMSTGELNPTPGFTKYGKVLKDLMTKMYTKGTYVATPFPEVVSLMSLLNDTKSIIICLSDKKNGNGEFLFAENNNGMFLGNKPDPVSSNCVFALETYQDKVRIKQGDLFLTATNVVSQFNKVETTKLKFAPAASAANLNTQLFYLAPKDTTFYISSALFPDGSLVYDEGDFSLRAQDKESLQPLTSGTLFAIKPYSALLQKLMAVRGATTVAKKIAGLNDIVNQRSGLISAAEDLYMLLAEIYVKSDSNRPSLLTDPKLRDLLLVESDAVTVDFSNLIDKIYTAFGVEGITAAAPWWSQAEVKGKFNSASGLIVNMEDFVKLAYPDQVKSLEAPLDRLTSSTIGDYLKRLAVVTKPETIINAFEVELTSLDNIIKKVQLKTGFEQAVTGSEFSAKDAMANVTAMKNFGDYVKLATNLKAIFDGLGVIMNKTPLVPGDKDMFVKQAERLVSVKNNFPLPKSPTEEKPTRVLKTMLQTAANNQMIDRADRLNALANAIEEDLQKTFEALKSFGEQLSFLESRRLLVSDVSQIFAYLMSLKKTVDNIFKASATEKTRLKTLVDLLPSTAQFKAQFSVVMTAATAGFSVTGNEYADKTVEFIIKAITNIVAKSNQNDQIYQIIIDFAASVTSGKTKVTDEDLPAIFDATLILVNSDYLTVTLINNLQAALKGIKSNASQALIDKTGATFDDLERKIAQKLTTLTKQQQQKTWFTINLELAEKRNGELKDTSSSNDVRVLLEILGQLVDDKLGALNQDESMRLVRVVESAVNKRFVTSSALASVTAPDGSAKTLSAMLEFLKDGIDPKNNPTLDQRVANLIKTIPLVVSGIVEVKVLSDKVNGAVAMLNVPTVENLDKVLDVLKRILYEEEALKAYYEIFYPIKIQLEEKKKALTTTDVRVFAKKPYVDQISDLKKRVDTLSSTNKKAFIDDLVLVIADKVKASMDDQTSLLGILNKAQFDPVFRSDPVNNISWFNAQTASVQEGPSIDALLTFIKDKVNDLIDAAKSSNPPTDGDKGFVIQKILAIQAAITKDGSRDMLAKIGSSKEANTVLFLIDALKSRVMPEKASMLDKIATEFLTLKDTISKSGQAKVILYIDLLNDLSAQIETIYVNPNSADISTKIETFKQKVEDLIYKLPQAIDQEPNTFLGILENANRVEKISSDPGFKYAEFTEKIKAGPSATQILTQIRALSQSSESLTQRDIQLLVQLAQRASTNKSILALATEGSLTLQRVSKELRALAAFRLKGQKYKQANGKMDDAPALVLKAATDLDDFFNQSQQTNPWVDAKNLFEKISNLPLNNRSDYDTFATNIKDISTKLLLLSDSEINTLKDFFKVGGKIDRSTANMSSSSSIFSFDERSGVVAGSSAELIKLLVMPTYTQKADNLMVLVSKAGIDQYEDLVKSRVSDLFTDDRLNMAVSEGYDLKKVRNALQYFLDNTLATYEDSDPTKLDVINKIKQLTSTIESIANKSQADKILIGDIENRLRNAKSIQNVNQVFADLTKMMLMRAQLSKENSDLLSRRVLSAAKNITGWQSLVRNSSPSANDYKTMLDNWNAQLQIGTTNTDRLNWINMKIYGSDIVREGMTTSPIKLSPEEQAMFQGIAQDAYNNAKMSTQDELNAFAQALNDAYYDDKKMGADEKIGNLAVQFDDLYKQRTSGQTFAELLDVLQVSVTAISTAQNAAEFMSSIEKASNALVEALPEQLKVFKTIVTSAQPKKLILSNPKYTDYLKELANKLGQPFTVEQIYKFLTKELGLDSKADPVPGGAPNPILLSKDRGGSRKDLIVTKFKEIMALKTKAQRGDLENFKKLMLSARNNELFDVQGAIDPIIAELDAYLATFASTDFKKFADRLSTKVSELGTIASSKSADSDKKISDYLNTIKPEILDYLSDADTSATNDEVGNVRKFLKDTLRIHPLVFPDKIRRDQVDSFVAALDAPLEFQALAQRLKNFAYNNIQFTDDIKKVFRIILNKMLNVRDKATAEQIKDMQENVLDYVLVQQNQFKDDPTIKEARITVATPKQLPFDDLITQKKYEDAFKLLQSQVKDPNATKIYDKATWKNNLVKVTVTFINDILQPKSKADKLDFVTSATLLANDVKNKVMLGSNLATATQADKDLATFVYGQVTRRLTSTRQTVSA